ncbi:MAG: prepilin-type N-terminal cleavage/methylation domain-containing protein [Thermoleophilaceae bacterium]
MSIQQSEAGFTLIELLVAMTLSLVVLGATLDAFAGFGRNSRAVNVKNDSQQDVRAATDQLARELRNAVSSGHADAGPSRAEPRRTT